MTHSAKGFFYLAGRLAGSRSGNPRPTLGSLDSKVTFAISPAPISIPLRDLGILASGGRGAPAPM